MQPQLSLLSLPLLLLLLLLLSLLLLDPAINIKGDTGVWQRCIFGIDMHVFDPVVLHQIIHVQSYRYNRVESITHVLDQEFRLIVQKIREW